MKTLRLDLESLRVESFRTSTPDAHVAKLPPTQDRSCLISCPLACGTQNEWGWG
jgi:hypothetical protein